MKTGTRAGKIISIVLFPLLIGGIFAGDQLLKKKSASSMKNGGIRHPFGKKVPVTFRYSENDGAMLRLGAKHPLLVRGLSLALSLVLTLVFIGTLGHAGKGALKTGLALLLGGAWSNTYDRLRHHFVTDYVSFDVGTSRMRDIVYNIGDFAIVLGAMLTALGA